MITVVVKRKILLNRNQHKVTFSKPDSNARSIDVVVIKMIRKKIMMQLVARWQSHSGGWLQLSCYPLRRFGVRTLDRSILRAVV